MSSKVYILLDVVDGKAEQVVQVLQEIPSVVMVEALEGSPDVVLVMEAAGRKQLVKLTIQALDLVETMTEHFQLLPVKDRRNTFTCFWLEID